VASVFVFTELDHRQFALTPSALLTLALPLAAMVVAAGDVPASGS